MQFFSSESADCVRLLFRSLKDLFGPRTPVWKRANLAPEGMGLRAGYVRVGRSARKAQPPCSSFA